MEYVDTLNSDRETAGHTSMNQLLTSYMERGVIQVEFARSRTALEVLAGITGGAKSIESAGDEGLYLPVIFGRYVLAGHVGPYHTGHKDFEVRKGRSPGFFALVPGSALISRLVRSALCTYLHFSIAEIKKLAELFCLEEVRIPAFNIFVVHEYL